MYARSFGIHVGQSHIEVVEIEVYLGKGLPMMIATGNLSTKTKEGIQRVKAALSQLGIKIPPKRITINISPAKLYKTSTSLDLPICMALLGAMGLYPKSELENTLFIGEIGLSGEIKQTEYIGNLSFMSGHDFKNIVIPVNQCMEISRVEDRLFYGLFHLKDILGSFKEISQRDHFRVNMKSVHGERRPYDLEFIKGQASAMKGLAIALAGRHSCILVGPPGVGKSMLARNSIGLLPDLSEEEYQSIQGIYQGRKDYYGGIPLRIPDVEISYSSMFGGGAYPKPGEVSLAHHGILLLEEMTDFKTSILRGLRVPLEEKKIKMIRKMQVYEYPADFLLIGTMNQCPCGAPSPDQCICTYKQKMKYRLKLSHSLLDRIHMLIDVQKPNYQSLGEEGLDIDLLRNQIKIARLKKLDREKMGELLYIKDWEKVLNLGEKERELLEYLYEAHGFSVRSYLKFLQLIRTIGDMEEREKIEDIHIMEALLYQNYMEDEK